MTGGFTSIQHWLREKGVTLWGGYWDVTDKVEGPLAAEWFQTQMEEYEEWKNRERRITAGAALNNLSFQERSDIFQQALANELRLGRGSVIAIEPVPSNGGVATGDQSGYQHPEGSASSSDSQHSGGDEGDSEGNRRVQEDGEH